MSTPASLISIENGVVNIHDRGCGHDIEHVVVGGPASVAEYVLSEEGFLFESINVAWGQGGLLVDYDNKVILMFSVNDADWDEDLNNSFMDEMRTSPLWEGWTLEWARKHLYDFARYIGKEDIYLEQRWESLSEINFVGGVFAPSKKWCSGIAVVSNGDAEYYPMDTIFPFDYLTFGPDIIQMLSDKANGKHFETGNFYSQGVIVDMDNSTIYIWAIATDVLPQDIEQYWPGWKVYDFVDDKQGFLKKFDSLIGREN